MLPVLIQIGPIPVRTYGLLMAIGVLSAIFIALKLAKNYDLDKKVLTDFFFYSILAGLIGAKLFLFVTEFKYFTNSWSHFKDLLFSGGTFYGGLIFGALYAAWFGRKHKMDFRIIGDISVPGVALAHFFGRMGCFGAGCCWGRHAHDCAIAVTFTNTENTTGVPLNTPLFPTQVMEATLELLNFIFLLIFFKRKKFHGQVFLLYLFNYSLIRFFMEYFRGDDDRGYIFGSYHEAFTSLSVPQLISIICIVTAIILYMVFKKKSQKENEHT